MRDQLLESISQFSVVIQNASSRGETRILLAKRTKFLHIITVSTLLKSLHTLIKSTNFATLVIFSLCREHDILVLLTLFNAR